MPTKEDLILEKRRYGLVQEVTNNELKLLEKGMPVQKIIGYVDLANVSIDVSKNVLIPRYETEELILLVLQENKDENLKILDLCCGSGFIGIALKKHKQNWNVTMSDISLDAIEQSKINIFKNNVNINIIQSDLFKNIKDKFDIIVCNPPYISHNEELSSSVLNYEPHTALFANDNGLWFYKEIIKNARNFLNDRGKIYFEINPLHMEWWKEMQKEYNIVIHKDISQKNRMVVFRYE
ncbi:peptide chain release factor N(5)-glutamine methyltransferase [Mycoplasma leonicaptivi]|uniref:peptide chain release factor N(5)-glutamine methyltransferase n=1 Tax=Mycoplasma leonicaptivi TaxID=36742 RepID=UPI00047F8BE4|nr:peptide chain release factor N(5)-glutamine methyltransferase [Mycoplasma leonicaptivi]